MKFEEADESDEDLVARYIIPPICKWKVRWDFWIGFLIIYSVMVIPYRIGFDVPAEGAGDAFDIVVDVFFFIDILVNFRTAYVDEEGNVQTVPEEIAIHYLKTWFTVDFFSTVPIDRIASHLMRNDTGRPKGPSQCGCSVVPTCTRKL